MARINIEDSLYRDGRFIKLCIKLGNKWTALGALIEAWALAQTYVNIEDPCGLIPLIDWGKKEICQAIIDVGLAEIRDDRVYMRGAAEQFHWLWERKIAGRKGGLATAKLQLSYSKSKQNVPSSSFSFSSSKNINTNTAKSGPDSGSGTVAKRILEGIKKFGPSESDKLKQYVGVPAFDKVSHSVGWQYVRELKRDGWTLKNIERILEQ